MADPIHSALDRLERAVDTLESSVDRRASMGPPIDEALRSEVQAAIAALDTMIGKPGG